MLQLDNDLKAGRNVTLCNKNGQVFSEDYCPFHYIYFMTVLLDEYQFTLELYEFNDGTGVHTLCFSTTNNNTNIRAIMVINKQYDW